MAHLRPTNGQFSAHVYMTRSTQLPSPSVSQTPNHLSPSPTSMPAPRPSGILKLSVDPSRRNVTPMEAFVHGVLRRSWTSCYALHTALSGYLDAVQHEGLDITRQENEEFGIRGAKYTRAHGSFKSTTAAPASASMKTSILTTFSTLRIRKTTGLGLRVLLLAAVSPASSRIHSNAALSRALARGAAPALRPSLPAPRSTFLAPLILASKFTQAKCYSNHAWARLAGLLAREIGRCERVAQDVCTIPALVKQSQRRGILSSDGRNTLLLTSGGTLRAVMAPPGNNLQRCSTLSWCSASDATRRASLTLGFSSTRDCRRARIRHGFDSRAHLHFESVQCEGFLSLESGPTDGCL
ncbi:hypothetical protein BV25DRAFT_1840957 [Artomyces pyxidatus]|uniref:Uncharacterized protein n=1 Tax=Artomyces pyxidatus TaxID=48021 RepID=A0ACB8SRB9_9AGAM|nr:hypothetical protein BV25DRAFT_1840957 [Artomyces pyxidatus]